MNDILKAGRWGRYEVLGRLGAGSVGVVFEARDPSLRRRVALKVLSPRRDRTAEEDAERLAAEARAMARLAHPNVVAVFEIDRVGDHVYVAMELVAGTTLRGWLAERPRRWRDIVEMFVGAGRGLAAAHAAGLVHRDFRPDNVLIGRDGRPRVSDFGTPAPGAPDELAGQPIDARSDQLAFCAALWEALCGSAFPRATAEERSPAGAGAIAEPASGRRVPRWLLAMVRRGLAVDPAARWPEMSALLDAIEGRMRAWRRWTVAVAAAGVAVVAAGITVAATVGSRGAPEPCARPTERLADVWSPMRRLGLGAHLVAVDPVQGVARFAGVAAALDAGARSWSDMHVAACRATRVEGRQSDTLLDRRMECLDRWLIELADTVDVIAQAGNRVAVDRAVHAASSLSPLDPCADPRALAATRPPASAEDRAIAGALATRTSELDVARRAGRLDGLLPRAVDLVSAARALGHEPSLVDALVLQARVLIVQNNLRANEDTLRELVQLAARTQNDRAEAFAWLNLIVVIASATGKLDDALALVPAARAAVLRAGDPVDLHVELLYRHAIVLDEGMRPAEGRPLLEEAKRLLEQAGAESPTSPLGIRLGDVIYELGRCALKAEDPEGAVASFRRAIDRWRAVAGRDNIDEAYSWESMSTALQRAGKPDEALAAIREAVRIREARLGESAALGFSYVVYGGALYSAQRWDDSIAAFDRGVRMLRATIAPGDVNFADVLLNRGTALAHVHRFDDALRDFSEAIAIYDQVGGPTLGLAFVLGSRADLSVQRGRCAEAYPDFARSIALFEQLAGPAHHMLIRPLTGRAVCLMRSGRAPEAIPILERALRCKSNAGDQFDLARLQAYLGRARVETGRDVERSLAMVRAMRPKFAAGPDADDELPELDRWLASRARRR